MLNIFFSKINDTFFKQERQICKKHTPMLSSLFLHFSISILVGSVGGVVLSPSVCILVSAGAGFSSFFGSGLGFEITCL